MKKQLLKVALLAAIVFAGTSCVKDPVVDNGGGVAMKTGEITLASTRVNFDGASFEWQSGDKVGVSFIGEGAEVANLEGTIVVSDGIARVSFSYPESVSLDYIDFVVYHPYSAANDGMAEWNNELQFNVLPRQIQPNHGINVSCLPLLSAPQPYEQGAEVTLYNLGSIVKFNVYGNADEVVKNVSISTDGYGKVFSSGKATLTYTDAASTETVGKDEPTTLSRTTEGDAFAAQCSYTGDNNGVDVTLAVPTYSGASRTSGAVAYAVVYPFGAGERAKNAYISVTTDKNLYTWTRNLTAERGAGLVLNLNLANADQSYPLKSYTNFFGGKFASPAKTTYPTQTKYAEGERTWMVQNLNWAGYDDALGTASNHASLATEFGRYYGYYAAAATVEPASGSGWSECAAYSRSKILLEGRNAVDEMGLAYYNDAFTFGYNSDGEEYNGGVATINVHLDPTSDDGKIMRAQHQFVCPKGWHVPNDIDIYHLFMSISENYANMNGTSWSNGEPGYASGALDNDADPFWNSACTAASNNATAAPGNRGLTNFGPAAQWIKGSDNQLNGGLWANYTTNDTTKGWLSNNNEPMFATQECYNHIYTTARKNYCNPAVYLKNGVREDVGFNALPSGFTSGGTAAPRDVGSYFAMLVHGSYVNKSQNGFQYIFQLDYDKSRFRRIAKARSNTSFKGSVRCVKNYAHRDVEVDNAVASWVISDLSGWTETDL